MQFQGLDWLSSHGMWKIINVYHFNILLLAFKLPLLASVQGYILFRLLTLIIRKEGLN